MPVDAERRRKIFFINESMNTFVVAPHTTVSTIHRWFLKYMIGGDIFSLNKIFFPINQDNVHWTFAVVNMKEKCIRYYDSLGGRGNTYLVRLLLYLVDEDQVKNKKYEKWI